MTKPKKRVKDPEAEAFKPAAEDSAVSVVDLNNPKTRFKLWSMANPTALEKKVWKVLGGDFNPWGFTPQVEHGEFQLDFYSKRWRFCIEADGPEHLKTVAADATRDAILAKAGIITLRLTPADLVRNSPQKIYDLIEVCIRDREPVEDAPAPEQGKSK